MTKLEYVALGLSVPEKCAKTCKESLNSQEKLQFRKEYRKMKELNPNDMSPPFARYAHGVEIPRDWRLVQTSGQLGIRADESVPEGAYEQAIVCFQNIEKILRSAGMGAGDVAHIKAFVTDRSHMSGYMRARDEFIASTSRLPSSTLLIVSGFTRPEFKVEVEVLAAAP
ncbi:RidA family protein [Ruegeria sp. HKCCC2111]|uniref:RidA family protein n=1 Tax=Ruegeria sp. HKCCC2111 TaxID=2682990 RepID=UPI00353032D5